MGKPAARDEQETLRIKLKHLQNDFELTREEYESTSRRYLDILVELKNKNEQLIDLQKNLEKLVASRTEQLEKTQQVLQQKSEELQVMIDCSPAMIFYKDSKGRYVRVNKAFAEFTGMPIKKIIGKTNDQVFKSADSGFVADDSTVISTGEAVVDQSVNVSTTRGERDLLVTKLPYHGDEGKTVGIVGFALDVTDHRQLEYEKSKVIKLESLGVLAGGIAHDFNNILTAILGNISLSQTMVEHEDEIFRRLKNAEDACLKAKDLTQQLLTFARGGTPVKKTTSLREMIKEITRFALSGSNVRSCFEIADDLKNVDVDEEQITQVINNLVLNAAQSMPEGGVINVNAGNVSLKKNNAFSLAPGDYIKISIADRGHGVSPEDLPHIFDPFFTTRESASGMGSATAWSIVKRHGGHITIESEPDNGSVFEIYLPTSSAGRSETKEAAGDNNSPALNILVMDDDEMVCDIAGHILTHLGHSAEFVYEGEEAVRLFGQAENNGKPFDLVILDLTIPGGMGGKQTVVRLREINPEVKALVSSGYSNDPVLTNHSRYGFDGVVTKPFNVDGLRKSMEAVIARR
ncbi:MAG: response regulator [Candidatus Glassbacteria bacterium]|nr:response regulator [Candidatus Glassbacteria bacterium]